MSRTSATSTTPSRVRAANSQYSVISRTRAQDDSSKPKSSGHDPAKNRRSSLLKRANSREEDTAVLAPQRARSVNRPAVVEQFGCPRRQISRKSDEAATTAAAAEEDEKRKKMEEKLVVNESLIKDLQAQVLSLKTELEEARNSNAELELKNKKLSQDLVSAEAKISSLSSNDKIKRASIKLAKTYMNRVANELESARNMDRESTQEALLLQGVRFAYRTHQFAGGLDPETLCALEEIKQRVPGHLRLARGNLAGAPS
ncbi:hypothetical protein F2Q68_00043327 [Brassica cretica]|uniref:Uncharacterized protein n=1 Tax=Brassica cretica TaxID=69181 RepID=A0A8S9LKV6_BRACR|nr:hypothetical protein F2Q68_00043327 [Brassica cretica]